MRKHCKDSKVNKVINCMLERLIEQYNPIKIVLFGSHALGNSDADSDIDLLIVKDTQDRFIDRWCTVGSILAGTHTSIPVDTLVLTPQEVEKRLSMGDQFIAEILEKGKVLYAA
ncbi:MAG: nucleotidyltransferase domain-containing protein [Verrucomicrobia bacterium]|nr:nucleotidyltransferase domain-containing protein [Verrucomicrobiota bacterium]